MWREFKRQLFGSKPKQKKTSTDGERLRKDTAKAVAKNKKIVRKFKKQFDL